MKGMRLLLPTVLLAVGIGTASGAVAPFEGAYWVGENAPQTLSERTAKVGRGVAREQSRTCPVFTKRLVLTGTGVVSARAHVTGLGLYDLRVNGLSPDPLRTMTPAWTCPEWCVYYDTYDVAPLLARADGKNAEHRLEVQLAGGYDDGVFAWNWRWLGAKRMIFALDIAFADGTAQRVVSDGSWKWHEGSPRVSASLYDGEVFDATRPACASEHPVALLAEDGLRLAPNPGVPVRLCDPIPPVKATARSGRRVLLDFGVNRAGVTELRAKLPRGTCVTMRHAEEVKDGELDVWTQKTAQQQDVYVAAGTGSVESYRPRFTYHGYRYVEVSGLPEGVDPMTAFVGWGVSADVREKATFACSDATLNWLWDVARRSMRSNFMSYPSDCCMRNERTPCLMDSQVYEDAAFQAFDMERFYSKWLYDAARYELSVDPEIGNNDNPDWAGDPFTLAERFLTYCAATNVALREYGELKRAAESFAARSADGLWAKGFGDWCSPLSWNNFSPELVNSAMLFEVYRVMARLAVLKGVAADAARYADLRERTRAAFVTKFYDPKAKSFAVGRAVEQILPLQFGLVPEGDVPSVVETLRRRIIGPDKRHLVVGIYGNRYAGDVLLEHGLGDLWLEGVRTPTWPSFGFMRTAGATSLWEQWTRDGEMNSHNHAMFAGATSCFFTHLAGIRPAADGYARVRVKPCFPKGLDAVRVTLETPSGRLAVDWRRRGRRVEYRFESPKGLPCAFELPSEADLVRVETER